MAMAARIPMMATTISSSIRVNPFSSRLKYRVIMLSLLGKLKVSPLASNRCTSYAKEGTDRRDPYNLLIVKDFSTSGS
jgi:hypothetical protein